MAKSLDQVREYRNSRVIQKFREELYFDEAEATGVFRDLLAWLWLASSEEGKSRCSMYHPMNVMDKMWHTFISFTKDYQEFCSNYLDHFVHHEPHTREETVKQMTSSNGGVDPFDEACKEVGRFQELVYDMLGSETLIRWFCTYPHVYSPDEMRRRVRPQFSERGFLQTRAMHQMGKSELLEELSKNHHVAAWCGGPGCGAMCMEAAEVREPHVALK